jgi:meiosis-specific serine/threonine-protein kinase MEK1
MFTTLGTPEYCAPEVGFEFAKIPAHLKSGIVGTYENDSRKGYDFKCDIWSLGIIAHIMLSGISPFYGDGSEVNIIKSAKRGILNFKARQWNSISKDAINFVQNVLKVEINGRFSVDDCLAHIWIKRHFKDLTMIHHKILKNSNISDQR